MRLLTRLSPGVLYTISFLIAWLLAEGALVAVADRDVPPWSIPFNVGVVAPIALLAGVLGGVVFTLWVRASGRADPVASLLDGGWAWLWRGDAEARVRRTAWMLAMLLLLPAWFAAGIGCGRLVLESVKTTGYALALVLGLQLGTAVVLAAGAVVIAEPARWLLATIEARRAGAVRPGWLAAGAGLLAVSGIAALWATASDVMRHLPWGLAAGLLAGAGAVVALAVRSACARPPVRAAAAALAVTAALGAVTAWMPDPTVEARALFMDRNTLGAAAYRIAEDRFDFDGDGTLHLFGGGDCAPFDADIGPHRREIIDNGVDEDCSGSDMEVGVDGLNTGKTAHPRPEGISARPHVILITTDALSHGHTSVGGYERDTTPHLAEWAKRATVFETAFSLSTSTRLALPGLVTGMFNSMVPMEKRRIHPYHYSPEAVTLASLLDEQGYETIHIPGDDYFGTRRWGGYQRGFDVVDESAYQEARDEVHTGPEVTDRALAYLDDHRDGEDPLFLWVHYYDHHAPYETPSGHDVFAGTEEVDRYDNELHFADSQWTRLLGYIEDRFSPEDYLVVFTSDHGEAFDENHPDEHHDFSLHTAVLHVPLIIQAPTRRGERVGGLVSHADLLPTVANILGLPPARDWIGESLVPVLFAGRAPEKDVVHSLFYIPETAKHDEDGFRMLGLRTKDLYYFEDRRKEDRWLVDWQNDPIDARDLSGELPDQLEQYRYLTAQRLEWLRERERALTRHYR